MTPFFTSRSAVESFQDCPRYRYNQYFLGGKGVVPVAKSIPLMTGGAVHRGIEHLANRVRIGQEPDVEQAVQLAVGEYVTACEREGFKFSGKGVDSDKQQWFTFNEQKALIEALIRVWAIVELPNIVERYTIISVEREIEPIEIAPGVWFQAKVDMELKEKSSGDFHNYSLKTMKQWDERSENSYKSDLQGLTEIWAVEQDAARSDKAIQKVLEGLEILDKGFKLPQKNILTMQQYLEKQKQGKRVSAVRFCILIKGARYKSQYADDTELYITYNPLIRGYKNITPGGVAYAHSYKFPNPANKSGYGMLGKDWVGFNVWEEMGVKKWIEILQTGEIQPNCGDMLRKFVFSPVEYFRGEGEIEEAIKEIGYQEKGIATAIETLVGASQEQRDIIMNGQFLHIRKHCEFHFGSQCEYKELCWNPTVGQDPVGSGLYQIREPHHEAERNK